MQQLRFLAWELRPTGLEEVGLSTAIREYAGQWSKRYGVAADCYSSGLTDRALPEPVQTTVFRIVQESLTNVAKHAGAQRVSLILDYREGELSATIEDDGRGFDVEALTTSPGSQARLGLSGMQERAALVGGTLDVESRPGTGTTVFLRLPA